MEDRIQIKALGNHIGENVKIKGFVDTIRDHGNLIFIITRDISGVVQCVSKKNASPQNVIETAKSLTEESVVEISGVVKEEKQAVNGYEIAIDNIKILSLADPEIPIPIKNEKQLEETEKSILMDWRWLVLRKPKNILIFRIWTELEMALREYWLKNNYIQIHSPKIIGTASESGAEVFEVKYFDRKAFLAQSPQFYKQMAMACGFEKVFEVGPVFRAEPSFTTRHATEFTGYDVEISYINSHYDVMAEEEKMLAFAIEKIKEKFSNDIKETFEREVTVPKIPFPKISFEEAKKILKEKGIESEKEYDLSPKEERAISEYVKEKFNHEFVFITEYPEKTRPFYHMKCDDKEHTKSFDLLWNGLEITTGAQREHRYDVLAFQAKEKGLSLDTLKFYLNFFKYGCPPHGGFGIGANRLLMKLLNLPSISDAMFLFRGVNRIEP